MIPREMVDYIKRPEMAELLEHLDLHRFFESPQPAIDLKRVWELVTTIKESGIARVSDINGTERTIVVTPELIAEALQLSNEGDQVTKRREEVKVYKEKKKNYTFDDLVDQRIAAMCRIYNQFFHVCTKRPQKYTVPPSAIATTFTWALRTKQPKEISYASYIHSQIVKMGDPRPKYIGAGEMLTRIVYEAIDAKGQWDQMPSQNDWLRFTGDEEDEIPIAPPVSTRMKRKLETVKEEEEEAVEKPNLRKPHGLKDY